MRIRDGNNRVTEFDMTPPINPPAIVQLVWRARPVLPCERCSHRDVCAIRQLIDPAAFEVEAPASPHEAVQIGIRIDVECRHFAEDLAAAGVAASPGPGSFATTRAEARARESSRRGAEASKALRAAAKTPAAGGGPGKPPSQSGLKRSPEARERMRVAMVASYKRRRAATSGSAAPE